MIVCLIIQRLDQVFLTKENSSGTSNDGVLLAVGGRYDYLLQQVCDREYVSSRIFSDLMKESKITSITLAL